MPNNQIHQGFAPIVDENSKSLILGTLPGPESLISGEYYKNSRNSFWRIVYALFGGQQTDNYEDKCRYLLNNKLALWDIFQRAAREGAADTAINNETTNDFRSFLRDNPQIKAIIFNGQKAEKAFKRALPDLFVQIPHFTAWSTSGACTKTLRDKCENWRIAFDYLW